MQTPLEVEFQGIQQDWASIEKHVARLEQRYGRVTACRVVLKAPGSHRPAVSTRSTFIANGREVNVEGYGFPIGGVAAFDPGGSCPAVG
jgi:hypothetical protein